MRRPLTPKKKCCTRAPRRNVQRLAPPVNRVRAAAVAGHEPVDLAPDDSADVYGEPSDLVARRLRLAAVLTVPVALLAMVPPLQFAGWEWVALALSTPVVLYAGAGFHRAALNAARHRG